MRRPLPIIVICFFLCGCAAVPITAPTALPDMKSALAVWNVEDLSPGGGGPADLGDLLSARIIETVQQAGGYTVVERERLELALRELHLGSSALADETTRLRIGRLAGAKWMVFGSYQVIANQMRLDLRLVEVETGRVLKAVDKNASGSDLIGWLKAAEDAAKELI